MFDYLLKIRVFTDNLIGSRSTVHDIIRYALDSLPPDFNLFATMVNAQKGLSNDDVYHLLAEDLPMCRRNLGVASVVNSSSAFAALSNCGSNQRGEKYLGLIVAIKKEAKGFFVEEGHMEEGDSINLILQIIHHLNQLIKM